jgi:hypothetical protein
MNLTLLTPEQEFGVPKSSGLETPNERPKNRDESAT